MTGARWFDRGAGASLRLQRTNALEHAAEIKQLFLAHDRPEFPEFFDRAYPHAFRAGAASWLGREANGELAMYAACFPHRFKVGPRLVVGGLLVNLMVSKTLRTFFPAFVLIRRMTQDLKAEGVIDFLYADPNEQAAAVLAATGFTRIGTLQRYVLPVTDRRAIRAFGIGLFHELLHAVNGFPSHAAGVPQPATEVTVEPLGLPEGPSAAVRTCHNRALYVSRVRGYPSSMDWWFTYHRRDASEPPAAALLVRGPHPSGVAELRAVRRGPGVSMASLLPQFITELRRRGCTRCHVGTVAESTFGRELKKVGFFPRQDKSAIVAKGLTPTGEECVGAIAAWEVTDVDFDR